MTIAVVPPSPLPPRDDPAVVEARGAQDDYVAEVQVIRSDPSLSELEVARRLADLWTRTSRRLAELVEAFWQARRARLEFLERSLPIGPGIDEDASQADRAVLSQAWQVAWGKAQGIDRQALRSMLGEAQRWGDELGIRAAITSAIDQLYHDVVEAFAPVDPQAAELYREWLALRALFTGRANELMFLAQATRQPPRPPEMANLRLLEQAADRQERQRTRTPGVTEARVTGRVRR